jgi:general secretion pathway protein G
MMRSCRKKCAGFTLVELLVVIVILAVLAAIVVPKFLGAGERSREAALKSDLKVLRNAVALFYTDCKAYPSAMADLGATAAPAQGKDSSGANKAIAAADWNGPYVESVPTDPISGNAFNYSTTSPTVGKVWSSASGTARDGSNYSDW